MEGKLSPRIKEDAQMKIQNHDMPQFAGRNYVTRERLGRKNATSCKNIP